MKDKLSKGMTFFALNLLLSQSALAGNSHPKLIFQITVDQLRGDLPGRFGLDAAHRRRQVQSHRAR